MKNDLVVKIENVRKQMINVGMSSGFTSEETIRLSKKLDNLINLQMKLFSNLSAY
ncbi:aspartyl-phosphate phosphatase Spo0E family protein [Neobacillus vireti]|uniref:aspartyl-phosphate phosphatase Spo0E family protein n=1 Tax=Neobacillus vireti TaxID=220686 RepID=UPI002FFFDD9D